MARRDYRDAVIVVTGAGSGIGRELALRLGERGARLVLTGRRRQRLEQVRDEIDATAPPPLVATCDVGNAEQVQSWAASIAKATGAVDVLVNNAGRGGYGPFDTVRLATHSAVIDTNLRGIIHTTHALLPAMLQRGAGQLVFVSSVLGELPALEHAVYGATKAAVNAFAGSLRHELRGRGVGITVAAPGLVHSEFAEISATPRERFAGVPSRSAAHAAADVLRAMETGRALAVDDQLSAAAISLRRHVPRLFGWIFGQVFERVRRRS